MMTKRDNVMHRLIQIAVLVLVPIPLAVAVGTLHRASPWKTSTNRDGVTLAQAMALEPIIWVDARPTPLFDHEHIPNAIPLNEGDWDGQIEAVMLAWQPQSTIVVYCDSQQCDASGLVAARIKEELGTERVYVLKGGWETWKNATPR